MMKKQLIFLLICCSVIALISCEKATYKTDSGPGKRPIYGDIAAIKDIKNLSEQPIEQTGTIVVLDSLFFLLEYKKGIHVYNITDSTNTQYLTFMSIPTITDFVVGNGNIYADSWRDLVTIDIGDIYNITEISRIEGVFEPVLYPPLYDGIFECVDERLGVLIGWEDVFLENPLCRTNI